jgi:multiple sugar transport system ATP-binding protein
LARVVLKQVNKIYQGTVPAQKSWFEFWKPGTQRREVHVVQNVDLEIRDGEFLVLVGPSGCGKSTTLRMVAGLENITSGDIFIDDTRVNELSPKDRDIAMVFQNYALYPHMNVYENMAFGLRIKKMPPAEIDERVRKAASLLKIEPYLQRKPKELSGGQRQRVAMGRAIVRRPKVFLMDEPLSNLDAKLRVQMRAELQKLHRTLGVTTIYVTHDQTEAMTLGHRIVLMRDGVIQQIDTPLNIYERPANQYTAGFVGSPPMNFVNATVVGEGERLFLQGGGFRVEVPEASRGPLVGHRDKSVVLGMRPESIGIADSSTPPGSRFEASVEVSEEMGSEVYLHLSCGDDTLVARVDAHAPARVGEAMQFAFDLRKMHVFDKTTEAAIVHGPGAIGDGSGERKA